METRRPEFIEDESNELDKIGQDYFELFDSGFISTEEEQELISKLTDFCFKVKTRLDEPEEDDLHEYGVGA